MTAVVNCPTCAAKVEWTEQNRYRPFCSERCKQIDLGAWAEEKYTIPAADALDDALDDLRDDMRDDMRDDALGPPAEDQLGRR